MFCKSCGKQLRDDASFCPNCGISLASLKSDILDVFCRGMSNVPIVANESDLFVYPRVPENVKNSIRTNFSLDYNDNIFFIRDTSWLNTRDQGLVITDRGVTCIPDNDKKNEFISFNWADVNHVEYKELVLYFLGDDENDRCPIHVSYFMKGDENTMGRSVGLPLADVFTRMANIAISLKSPFEMFIEQLDELISEDKDDEALRIALQSQKKFMDNPLLYVYISDLYASKKDYKKAIQICDNGLEYCNEIDTDMRIFLLYRRYSSFHELGNDFAARKDCLAVMRNSSPALDRGDGVLIKEDAEQDFKLYEQTYIQHFLDIPYAERKLIVPVNEYTDLSQKSISVLDVKRLPSIEFPIGHPIVNQLYVGHPFLANQYIPFEDYELTFIDDRIREFCLIMQFLGATEVSVESINGKNINEDRKENSTITGESSYKIASANVSVHKGNEDRLVNSIRQAIGLSQKYTPSQFPVLPEGLVWYPHEASWQRLYQQRMQGSLHEHREKIEIRKNRVLQSSELKQAEGEFKSLLLSVHGTWDKSMETFFEMQEDADLTIYVRFAPLSSLKGDGEKTCREKLPIPVLSLTPNEQEYLEEYKECLEEDGEISLKERRLLDRLRMKLGISNERALELEEALVFQLTEEEQEYLEEYKMCLEDGEISSRERRLLDRLREKLGISQDRANEIENID